MNDFDRMINALNLLNEAELEALTIACQTRVEEKKKARREGLRQELMNNLQQTICAILNNGFYLTVENLDVNKYDDYRRVCLSPNEHYNIEIE